LYSNTKLQQTKTQHNRNENFVETQTQNPKKHIKGVKSSVSNLDDDAPNASNIKIAHFNIYDPRSWENLDNKSRDILVENEPIIKMNLNFLHCKYFRHFLCELFKKIKQ